MSGAADNSTSVPDNTNGGSSEGSSSGSVMYIGIGLFVGFALIVIVVYVRYLIINRNGGPPLPPPLASPTTAPDANGTHQSGNLGMDLEDISCLPTFPYQPIKRPCRNKGHEHKEKVSTAECAVCLGELEEGEMVRVLPTCKHYFHVKCIDTWLSTCSSCPMCRAHPDPEKLREGSVSISPPWRQVMYSSSSERRQFGLGSCLGSPFVKTPSNKSPSILGNSPFHGSWHESPNVLTPPSYLHQIPAEARTP